MTALLALATVIPALLNGHPVIAAIPDLRYPGCHIVVVDRRAMDARLPFVVAYWRPELGTSWGQGDYMEDDLAAALRQMMERARAAAEPPLGIEADALAGVIAAERRDWRLRRDDGDELGEGAKEALADFADSVAGYIERGNRHRFDRNAFMQAAKGTVPA